MDDTSSKKREIFVLFYIRKGILCDWTVANRISVGRIVYAFRLENERMNLHIRRPVNCFLLVLESLNHSLANILKSPPLLPPKRTAQSVLGSGLLYWRTIQRRQILQIPNLRPLRQRRPQRPQLYCDCQC